MEGLCGPPRHSSNADEPSAKVADGRYVSEREDDRKPEVEQAVAEHAEQRARVVHAQTHEGERERDLDETRTARRERAPRKDVATRVCEHELGDGDVSVDELDSRPQAEDVAGPVEGVPEHAETMRTWARQQGSHTCCTSDGVGEGSLQPVSAHP